MATSSKAPFGGRRIKPIQIGHLRQTISNPILRNIQKFSRFFITNDQNIFQIHIKHLYQTYIAHIGVYRYRGVWDILLYPRLLGGRQRRRVYKQSIWHPKPYIEYTQIFFKHFQINHYEIEIFFQILKHFYMVFDIFIGKYWGYWGLTNTNVWCKMQRDIQDMWFWCLEKRGVLRSPLQKVLYTPLSSTSLHFDPI